MALMIPSGHPAQTNSRTAEPKLYHAFKNQLSDDFTVIHSIPWLSQATGELEHRGIPTGELDFLIMHPDLGILGIEVKGGAIGHDRTSFVILRSGERIDPVAQVRKSIHALAKWIVDEGGPKRKIGYALAFPESEIGNNPLPPALVDLSGDSPETICIQMSDLEKIGPRIFDIMTYWKLALNGWNLTRERIDQIVNLLCPIADYSAAWNQRITDDNNKWLILTLEQEQVFKKLIAKDRNVIEGRSGTGKTLLATTYAREYRDKNCTVRFVVFNAKLALKIQTQLDGTGVKVGTFHDLCREASIAIGEENSFNDKEWYGEIALATLKKAINTGKLSSTDVLIIDEAQVFSKEWLEALCVLQQRQIILACCDETQVFEFETTLTSKEISEIIDTSEVFKLTVNVRSPKSIFDKLLDILPPTDYQQISLRPNDDDTLIETISTNPAFTLNEVIRALNIKGVSRDSIVILHMAYNPVDHLKPDTIGMIKEIVPITKYRGLESPIIIIYAPEDTPSIPQICCAYSRATSFCHVIYSASSFARKTKSSFHEKLKCGNSTYAYQIQKYFPFKNKINAVEVVKNSANIDWSENWGCWIFYKSLNEIDELRSWMWKLYINETDHNNIIDLYDASCDPASNMTIVTAHKNDSGGRFIEEINFMWCDNCNRWTKTKDLVRLFAPECKECGVLTATQPVPEIAENYIVLDVLVSRKRPPTASEINQMPVYIRALGRWLALSESEKQLSLPYIFCGGKPLIAAARVLTGIDIMKAAPHSIITNSYLSDKYWNEFEWLQSNVEQNKWKEAVANNLGTWFNQYKWVTKIGPGKYKRVPDLPTKTRFGNHSDE